MDWKGIVKKSTAAVAGGLVVAAVSFSAPVHASNYVAPDSTLAVISMCFGGPSINGDPVDAACLAMHTYDYIYKVLGPMASKTNDTYAQVRSNSTAIGELRRGTNTLSGKVDDLGATVEGIRTKTNDTYVQTRSNSTAIGELRGAVTTNSSKVDSMGAKVDGMNSSVGEMSKKTADMDAQLQGNSTALGGIREQVKSNSTALGGIRDQVQGVGGSISAESQRIFNQVNAIGGALGTMEASMMDRFDRLASDWSGGGGSGSAEDAALAARQRDEIIKGLRSQALDCYEGQPGGVPWWASMQPRDTLGVPCSLFERTAERLSEFFKRKEVEDRAHEELKERRLELEEERRHQEAQEQRERMQAAEEVAAQRQAERDAAESAEAKAREAREATRRAAEEAAAERRHQELKKAVEDAANDRSAAETAADQARRDLQEEVSGLSDAVKSGFGELGSKIDGLGEAIRGMGSGGTSGPAIGAAPGVRSVKPTNLDGWKSLSSCVVVAPPKQGLCGAGPEFNFFGAKVKPLSYCGDMSAIRATVSFIGWVIVFAAAWMAFRWMLAAYGVSAPSEKSG